MKRPTPHQQLRIWTTLTCILPIISAIAVLTGAIR